jgi:hypothetical protein
MSGKLGSNIISVLNAERLFSSYLLFMSGKLTKNN